MKKDQKYRMDRWILKLILNLWTVLTIVLFIADFLSGNKFDTTASAIGIIYLGILGIYVSEKEYSRWKTKFMSRFLGEGFVIIWTVVMVIFVVAAPLSEGRFRIPAEFALIYTSVIAAFALTQH
jgi:membrane protease YdiL (CAAX protease family)